MSVPADWLKFAADDLAAAEVLLKARITNLVLFHSQQCVEKSLKALIAFEGRQMPKTHMLGALINSISDMRFDEFAYGFELLDQIYMPSRYPDALPGALPEGLPNAQQAAEALDIARQIYTLVQEKLSPMGQ